MSHLLIAGLGNPGDTYKNTRHNIGFVIIDAIAEYFNFPSFSSKFSSLISSKIIGNDKITLIKPQTYMNLSGEALVKAAHFYKIAPDDVIVIHDDLDLALARVKMKIAGGAGGHNGIKSIDQHLGKDYYRLRIGIGKPHNQQDTSDFVLHNFSKEEVAVMQRLIHSLIENFDLILAKDLAMLMNKMN